MNTFAATRHLLFVLACLIVIVKPALCQSVPGVSPESTSVQIGLLTSATKSDWLGEEIYVFNHQQDKYKLVLTTPLESRDAMQQILDKKVQPVLWSPSSPVWIDRLNTVWQQKNNNPIVNRDDKNDFGVYLQSPMVFLTTREKASYLREQLGGIDTWSNILALSLGEKRPPWGKFKFAYADPMVANSGMLAVGMILNDYAQRTRQTGDLAAAAGGADFGAYLQKLHRAFVYDAPVKKGSGPLADAYAADPARYDFILTYESTALSEVAKNADLAVVYPSPTIMSEQSVAVLLGDWVTDEQKQGAEQFMAFLGTHEALAGGVRYNFRPDRDAGDVSLAHQLTKNASHGFQLSVVSVDPPPYDAINAAIYQWQRHVPAISAP